MHFLRKHGFSFVFSSLCFMGLIVYIVSNRAELHRVSSVSTSGILLIYVWLLSEQCLVAAKVVIVCRLFGVQFRMLESCFLVQAGTLLSMIPLSGVAFRFHYLKRVHGLSYARFAVGMMANGMTQIFATGLLGLGGLLWGSLRTDQDLSLTLFLLFVLVLLGSLTPTVHIYARARRKAQESLAPVEGSFWRRTYAKLERSMHLVAQHPRALIWFLLLNVLIGLSGSARFWFIGSQLEYPVTLDQAFVFCNLSRLSSVITMLPTGMVGLREALAGFGSYMLDLTALSGVLISTYDRIVNVIAAITIGVLGFAMINRNIMRVEKAE